MDPLMMAIQGTSPETLRSVMGRMCKSNPEVKRVAESLLLVPASSVPTDTSSPGSEGSESKKRKLDDRNREVLVPKYDSCVHCGEEFDVSLNKGKVCDWHTGEKEMVDDASVWDDYEDWREGPIDDKIDDPDFAEGYTWTCCGGDGIEEGCVKGPHEGNQYLGLTSIEADEGLPDAKHQKMDVPERKFSNSVADLLEQEPAKSVVESKVQVPFKSG